MFVGRTKTAVLYLKEAIARLKSIWKEVLYNRHSLVHSVESASGPAADQLASGVARVRSSQVRLVFLLQRSGASLDGDEVE